MSDATGQQHVTPEGTLDLGRGDPDPALLPLGEVRAAAEHLLSAADATVLQYGAEPGDPAVRAALGRFLRERGAALATPERLFVTAGASSALSLICTRFAARGARVLVADPSYHLALRTFADHGLTVEGLASDADGPLPGALEAALARGPVALLYLVPAFGNPTGATIPPDRARRLVEACARHGVRVVADEVYRLTGFAGPPPASLSAYDPDVVLALGSVSKILAPGLRVGWIEGPERDLAALAETGQALGGGGMNPVTAAVVRDLIEADRLGPQVERVRDALRARYDAVLDALRRALPEAEAAPVAGGYFLWVRVPGFRPDRAEETLARHGLRVAPGTRFAPPLPGPRDDPPVAPAAEPHAERMRLCFAHYAQAELGDAVGRLAAAVREADAGRPEPGRNL